MGTTLIIIMVLACLAVIASFFPKDGTSNIYAILLGIFLLLLGILIKLTFSN